MRESGREERGAYTGDLGASEALIGARAREVCEALWATDGGFEIGAVRGGGRVLPDGCVWERKGAGSEIGEGRVWMHGGQGGFGGVGPVDRAVLL